MHKPEQRENVLQEYNHTGILPIIELINHEISRDQEIPSKYSVNVHSDLEDANLIEVVMFISMFENKLGV